MKKGCLLFCAVLLVSLSPFMVFAQKDITGKVMDSQKNIPLEGATIFENIKKCEMVTRRGFHFVFYFKLFQKINTK